VSRINLWEPCYFAKVPDGPQTYSLDVLWLQKGEALIHMSVWSQIFTFTKNVGRCFFLWSTPPTQWTDSPTRWRCLLRVLCPVRCPVTALDCVLLKERNLALAPRQGPEISSRACLKFRGNLPPLSSGYLADYVSRNEAGRLTVILLLTAEHVQSPTY
jgi:hypothetical protein